MRWCHLKITKTRTLLLLSAALTLISVSYVLLRRPSELQAGHVALVPARPKQFPACSSQSAQPFAVRPTSQSTLPINDSGPENVHLENRVPPTSPKTAVDSWAMFGMPSQWPAECSIMLEALLTVVQRQYRLNTADYWHVLQYSRSSLAATVFGRGRRPVYSASNKLRQMWITNQPKNQITKFRKVVKSVSQN
jgi:hypothetical protein